MSLLPAYQLRTYGSCTCTALAHIRASEGLEASTWQTSALEVFLNDMRYINPRFTYLLTYLDQAQRDCGQSKQTSSLQISVSSLPAGELKTAVRWRQFVKTATLPAGARAW